MYNPPSYQEVDEIIARARAERAGAFGRMFRKMLRR